MWKPTINPQFMKARLGYFLLNSNVFKLTFCGVSLKLVQNYEI